jgi:flavin reductase (DIM6/NTAB) family NADH-FMN oxidoreductase RutF
VWGADALGVHGNSLAGLERPAGTCYKEQVVGPDDFRTVLGHFATGVTIITTVDSDGHPSGLTASSFTSVSLNPPLILVCVAHSAQSFPALRDSGRFAVNILSIEQEAISRRFATAPTARGAEKFEGLPYKPGQLGVPLLEEAHAHLECVTVHAYEGGDHTIFVGRVEAVSSQGHGPGPLLYYRGKYRRLFPPPEVS